VSQRNANTPVVLSLSAAVVLWGANNVALKQVLGSWPPLFTGATRFMTAGLLMLVLSAGTRIFGTVPPPPGDRKRALWRAGLVLALYIAACNWTLRFLPASQFALHMAASPAWALILEGLGAGHWGVRLRRWAAVLLTFSGVFVLLLPSLRSGGEWVGHLLGATTGLLWTFYSRECRSLGTGWSGAGVSGHTLWRGGVLLAPLGVLEVVVAGHLPPAEVRTLALHLFCITLGGVVPFALWTQALTHWPVSRVALFGNLIPLSTTAWAFVALGEPLSPTFGLSTLLILGGVLLGQVDWTRILGRTWVPEE
jgi:drug/metabolite transporter (DMT)-like permease